MSNIDVALIGDLVVLYSEYEVTNWIWPRQDYFLNSWNSKINFNLDSQYKFLVGKIYNEIFLISNEVNTAQKPEEVSGSPNLWN